MKNAEVYANMGLVGIFFGGHIYMSDDTTKGARFDQSVRDFVAFKGFVTKTKIPALTIEAALESRDKANQSVQNTDEGESTGRNKLERP